MSEETPGPEDVFADVREDSLTRPDGRVVAWTSTGPDDGVPVLRMPGTPGSRWGVRADRRPWTERNLRTIVTERPGFGRSTRLPGRGFAEHADDLAALLDHVGIERAFVTGGSGGGPHVLAFCARHPERVLAATVVAGFSPLVEDEIDQMIELSSKGYRLGRSGDADGLRELLTAPYDAMTADPLGGFEAVMEHAPESDREIMADPLWRLTFARSLTEAFAQGIEGWIDEGLAMDRDWTDFDLAAIRASITWWHGTADKNCPWSAAERLVTGLPTATLRDLGDGGHFAAYRREGELLDELLARGNEQTALASGA